jgi:hypothetical protein
MRNEVFNVLICYSKENLLKNFFTDHIIQKENQYYLDFNKSIPSNNKNKYSLWGTKRLGKLFDMGIIEHIVFFSTDKTPAIDWVKNISPLYPEIEFNYSYHDEMKTQFQGELIIKDGKIKNESYSNLKNYNPYCKSTNYNKEIYLQLVY